MPWGQSSSTPTGSKPDDNNLETSFSSTFWSTITTTRPTPHQMTPSDSSRRRKDNDSLLTSIRAHFSHPHNWIAPAVAACASVGLWTFYQTYLRRIPGSDHITPSFFRRRSLLGKVTSVGDGDGFHMFHTPGGRLAGWGWLRRVPGEKKELRGRTVRISFLLSSCAFPPLPSPHRKVSSQLSTKPRLLTNVLPFPDPRPPSRHRRPRMRALRQARPTFFL